jgi:hypothetical protein
MMLMVALAGGASANVKLAEKEIRRYVYLRTGEFLSIVSGMVGGVPAAIVRRVRHCCRRRSW